MRIGTWNVRSMLMAGKMTEVAREMKRYNIEILALQEIRWSGQGAVDKKEYTLYYSGNEKQGRNGTGFMISETVRGRVISFRAINGRLSYIRIENKQANISVVNAYAPTEDADEEEKVEFYEKLEEICGDIPRNDMLIIAGDFNAKIGKEEYNEKVSGKETIHNTTSDNGSRVCNLAAMTNTFIVSTRFKHKNEHKITWMIPGSTQGNQIDHVLISKKWECVIQDVRSYRGANADSDHLLVIAKMKIKILKKPTTRNEKRWDTEKLKSTEHNQEFTKVLEEELNKRGKTNIEEEWTNIKESITQATKRVLGQKTQKKWKEWFDEECENKVKLKNEARKRWIATENTQELENYNKKRKEATKCCKKKKEQWINELMREIEANSRDNRRLYSLIKAQNKTKKTLAKIENEKWEKHFTELYKENEDAEGYDMDIIDNRDREEDIPTYDEYIQVIKHLKLNKAAGPDRINNELIKNGGDELITRIYDLITEIWKEETMPMEWGTGLLTPLYKKGDPTQCSNYRGIMLLNTTYKILTSIIRQRLSKYTEARLGEYQQGFRRGRSTIDAIHIMTQIIEKSYEHDIELHMLFIDFRQAFDSIRRNKLLEEMKTMEIPAKLIRLTKMTMEKSRARINTLETTSEEIAIETGVRQGDSLSTTLFNITLDGAVRKAGANKIISTNSTQLIAYADDIALIARDRRSLEDTFKILTTEAKSRGLEINQDKTKYMISSRRETKNIQQIIIGEYSFRKTENFKYLGVMLNGKNERSVEISERIQSGNRAYWSYHGFLKDKSISKETKLKIYKSAIRPVVTYAAETMCLTNKDEEKLKIFERRIYRRILGPITTPDGEHRRLMNHEIKNLMEEEDIIGFAKAQRLKWFGHVQRREPEVMIKRILAWKPMQGRPKGRPRTRWEDQVGEDIKKLEVLDWRIKIRDRKEWKTIVDDAKKHKRL